MNYLAHIYLSGKEKGVQIGNYVADAVKGNAYQNYPADMQKGILLHRKIDAFSDAHPIVREFVAMGRGVFGRYAPVVTDVLLDYLLASDFKRYTSCSLHCFAYAFYFNLLSHYRYLPTRFQRFMWHFILTNRLGRYASKEGVLQSLSIMVEYRGLRIVPQHAIDFLIENEEDWRERFDLFFFEIDEFCQRERIYGTTGILNS